MAYSVKSKKTGDSYYLHSKEVTLRGGRKQNIFYFRKEVDQSAALDDLPSGYEVMEVERTGLPMLRRTK